MAEALETSQLQKDDSASVPRTKLSEIGYTGIKTASGRILEEANQRLRFPAFIREVDEMLNDATIATGIQFTRMMLGRVKWVVKAPSGASPQQIERAKFIETCMHDMEHTFHKFILELTNYIPYGFSVHEKVFRKRLKTAGSKYNDGLIGWKKLPVRSQSTVVEWVFDDEGRNILGCKQSTANLTSMYKAVAPVESERYIPREKFLLFTSDSRLDNPLGRSPLAAIWTTWRYRKMMEEQEAVGAARDIGGIPFATMPSKYMAADASASDKAIFDYTKKMVANIQQNAQAGIILPSDSDENTKQPYFNFKLLSSDASSRFDTGEIIKRLNSQILVALGADVLAMGTDKAGSFSLAGAKTSLAAMMLEYRLQEIQDVLNNDLIAHTFKLNGWIDTELPTFQYEEFDELEPDDLSKLLQRTGSIGMLVRDLPTINAIRRVYGADSLPEGTNIDDLEFTNNSSRSGDGLEAGAGNGTSTEVATQDNSVANMENS